MKFCGSGGDGSDDDGGGDGGVDGGGDGGGDGVGGALKRRLHINYCTLHIVFWLYLIVIYYQLFNPK